MSEKRTKETKSIDELLKIGRFKYGHLKGISEDNLTESEKEQIDLYEQKHNINAVFKPIPRKEVKTIEGIEPNKDNLYKGFLKYYEFVTGKQFIKTNNSIANLEPIIKYFANDASFSESERVIKNINGKIITPNLNKGLLIISSPGNGKSSIMEVMQQLINTTYIEAKEKLWRNYKDWERIRFLFKTCSNIVTEYESIAETYEKEEFFKKYGGYRYCFDDLNREEKASNYGSKELFKDILFERNINKAKTYVTMNYPDAVGYQTIEHSLKLLGARYGAHIYDRLFEDFNFIEFKGGSFRK